VDALVIRDTYPDESVDEWSVAFFGNTEEGAHALLGEWQSRWRIEESLTVADRYRKLGRLFPIREGFARAWVHFAFLARFLLWFFDHGHPEEPRPEPCAGGLLVVWGAPTPSSRSGSCCRSCSTTMKLGSPSGRRSSPASASWTLPP
jgi:hypothetical protein